MRWGLAVLFACAACGDHHADFDAPPGPPDEMLPPPVDMAMIDGNPLTPDTLAGTGLCMDAGCTQINPAVHEYTPRFGLWSDTATKRRWIYLPPGTTIDTTDMNYWLFPVGTKLWKEFTRDGTRVETRYIVKLLADDTLPNAWYYVSYAWNATQDATTAVPQGVMNANGTQHDIPSRQNCRSCHERLKPTRVLGFGAIQLDATATSGLDLDQLIAMNLLSVPPTGAAGTPKFPLPGTAQQQATLGYLHANCGHCHNRQSPVHDSTPMELRLETGKLATVQATPAYTTTHDVSGMLLVYNGGTYDKIVKPNDPDHSIMVVRFEATTSPPHMPELGTEMLDPTGDAAIRAWILSLN